MKYKIIILLILAVFLGFLINRALVKYTATSCNNNVSSPANSTCAENNNDNKSEGDANITYKTFSSPKADFTFEYPSDWVYDEEEARSIHDGKEIKTPIWGFYPNLEGDYRNRPPYLAVSSPTYEVVDFLSAGYKGDKFPYQLNVFLSNDPETCITYEQYDEGIGKYVYWQKGECFATFANITDIYKTNMIIFYSFGDEEKNTKQIGEHIVKSIKIK